MQPLHKRPNIIIIGDIMLDINNYVSIEKIANEAPIPVFRLIQKQVSLGGCGNVLKNIYNLECENLYIFSVVGKDAAGDEINTIIHSMNVHNHIVQLDGYNTITKTRYFCENKLMFRCDVENDLSNNHQLIDICFKREIMKILESNKIDCIILSDYNKGVLNFKHCRNIIEFANENNIFTCVDPKDDYTKYIGCSLIKPNLSESLKLFHLDKSTSILDIHKNIFKHIGCKLSVVTMSKDGITLFDGENMIHEKTNANAIVDVTGAGDIVCSIVAYFLCTSKSYKETIHLATKIGTMSVQYPGTYTLTKSDILETDSNKVVAFDDLDRILARYKDSRIVFTNGCFDILHSGHIQLLEYCKSKGDIVVIGLNSDASIQRLKGIKRPINNLNTRIDLLKSMQYVDYIIAFDEDTPYNVIKKIKPYYLVKGGDYNRNDVIGADIAKETLIYNYVEGVSTTSTIQKIMNMNCTS